jgi:citrate lyase subunit beta/citryl-CoA lyase
VVALASKLDRLELIAGMQPGTVEIAVVATETPRAMFNLGSYTPAHSRLLALTWGAEDLAAAIGAIANKEDNGGWTSPYILARNMCLFAASAAEVAPIDTLYADYRDIAGLDEACRRSRRDGFSGRVAIHPDQVGTINAAYSPSALEIAHARKIVEAFAAQPDAGTLGIDGKMYDIPHLKAARKTLAESDD